MWYRQTELGEIYTASEKKIGDEWNYSEEDIVIAFDGRLLFKSQTETNEYKELETKYINNKKYEDEIKMIKSYLAATDYKALKFSDGALTEEEYAPIRAQRQAWRDEINTLEAQLGVAPVNYLEEV